MGGVQTHTPSGARVKYVQMSTEVCKWHNDLNVYQSWRLSASIKLLFLHIYSMDVAHLACKHHFRLPSHQSSFGFGCTGCNSVFLLLIANDYALTKCFLKVGLSLFGRQTLNSRKMCDIPLWGLRWSGIDIRSIPALDMRLSAVFQSCAQPEMSPRSWRVAVASSDRHGTSAPGHCSELTCLRLAKRWALSLSLSLSLSIYLYLYRHFIELKNHGNKMS